MKHRRKRRRGVTIYFSALVVTLSTAALLYTGSTVYTRSTRASLGTDISVLAAGSREDAITVTLVGQELTLDMAAVSEIDEAAAAQGALIPAPIRLLVPTVNALADWLEQHIPL